MNTSFCSAAKIGSELEIEGRVLKSGKTLGFTQVDIFVLQEGGSRKLVATGRHTKAL